MSDRDSEDPDTDAIFSKDSDSTGEFSEAVETHSRNLARSIALVASKISIWARQELKGPDGFPLTWSQATVLYQLRLGISTSTEIAKTLGVTRRAITTTVDQLVAKGLVARGDDDVDRRVIRLTITDEGEQVSYRFEDQLLQNLARLVAELPQDERLTLEQGLNILLSITPHLAPQFSDRH